eukprot:m.116393 g.116393  ORF g.116393 m.116393 type:complete len:240 (-) comp17180_c0_seq1:199-918(-)
MVLATEGTYMYAAVGPQTGSKRRPHPGDTVYSPKYRGLKGRVLPNGDVYFRDGRLTPSPFEYSPKMPLHLPKSTRAATVTPRSKTASGLENPHLARYFECSTSLAVTGRAPAPTDIPNPAKTLQLHPKDRNTFGFKRAARAQSATERLTHLAPNTYNTRSLSSAGLRPRTSGGYVGTKSTDFFDLPLFPPLTPGTKTARRHSETSLSPNTYNPTKTTDISATPHKHARRFSTSARFDFP